jgi:hypothetical protein
MPATVYCCYPRSLRLPGGFLVVTLLLDDVALLGCLAAYCGGFVAAALLRGLCNRCTRNLSPSATPPLLSPSPLLSTLLSVVQPATPLPLTTSLPTTSTSVSTTHLVVTLLCGYESPPTMTPFWRLTIVVVGLFLHEPTLTPLRLPTLYLQLHATLLTLLPPSSTWPVPSTTRLLSQCPVISVSLPQPVSSTPAHANV